MKVNTFKIAERAVCSNISLNVSVTVYSHSSPQKKKTGERDRFFERGDGCIRAVCLVIQLRD